MSSDASCEELSVREGAGYDEAFGSGDESEDFLTSSERGTSARSPDGNESYTEEGKDEVEKGREDEGVGDKEALGNCMLYPCLRNFSLVMIPDLIRSHGHGRSL